MRTITVEDGLFITYEVCDLTQSKRAHDCMIHMSGSAAHLERCMISLEDLDIDYDPVTLELYCQEHLDGLRK